MLKPLYVFLTCFYLTNLPIEAVCQDRSKDYKEINRKIYSYKKKDLNVKIIKDDSLTYTYVYFKGKDDVHALQLKRVSPDTFSANTYFFLDSHIAKIILARKGRRKPLEQSSYYLEKEQLVWKDEKNLSVSNFSVYFIEGEVHLRKAKEMTAKRNN